jgi:hypothetical protein
MKQNKEDLDLCFCCVVLNNDLHMGKRKYIWWETIDYLVYVVDLTKEVSKIIDYLEVSSLQYVI